MISFVQFLAVVLTAFALVPAGAHLAELANKINLSQDAYFTVQGIYRGWSHFGFVLFGALGSDLLLAALMRGKGHAFGLAATSFLLVAATLAIFFIWTLPANQATNNWTVIPPNWEALRAQWEYAHAAAAVLTALAFCAVTLSVLSYHRSTGLH